MSIPVRVLFEQESLNEISAAGKGALVGAGLGAVGGVGAGMIGAESILKKGKGLHRGYTAPNG